MNKQQLLDKASIILEDEYDRIVKKKSLNINPNLRTLYKIIEEYDPVLLKEIKILKPFMKTKSTNIYNESTKQEVENNIVTLRELGLSAHAISKVVGISHTTVNKILKKHGFDATAKETTTIRHKKLREIIYKLYVDIGFTMKEIGQIIGVTELTVRKHISEIAKESEEKREKIAERKRKNRISGGVFGEVI